MANKRIKDLATTATTTASGDFIAVDGTTNGTRKLSATAPAFLTSVTTPSLTSPASTPLTLGTGTSGAAITVLSADNNVGIGTTTPNKKLEVFKDVATNTLGSGEVLRILGDDGNTVGRVTELGFGVGPTGATFASALIGAVNISATGFGTKDLYFATRSSTVDVAPTERMRIATTGTVSISSATAGSSGAGALVVTGGLATGAASYFGGDVTLSKATPALNLVNTSASTFAQYLSQSTVNRALIFGQHGDSSAGTTLGIANAAGALIATATTGVNYPDKLVITTLGRAAPIYFGTNNTLALTLDGTTQAATFAGAVTAAVVTSTGAGYTNSGFQITNTSASRTTGFFLSNAGVTTIRDVTGVFDLFTINTSGNAAFAGTVSPQQTGTPPTYVKGAIYFDTALNKLRVGGATGWETITSV